MLKRSLHFVSVLLLSGGLFTLTGCWFKKKPAAPPASAQAPTVTEPQPAPQEQPPTAQPQEEQKPAESAETQPQPKPKPKPKQNHAAHKQAPKPEEKQQAALKPPPRIVIQEGGADASTGQISTATGRDDAAHSTLSTAKLLESTEANLRVLKRTLTADERATVAQIKDYMQQSRAATAQQDLVRAHNLALKAHLLSDELVKK